MNRKILDIAVPIIYGILVVVVFLTARDNAFAWVTVVGAMLVGLYFAALRRKLPAGPDQPPIT